MEQYFINEDELSLNVTKLESMKELIEKKIKELDEYTLMNDSCFLALSNKLSSINKLIKDEIIEINKRYKNLKYLISLKEENLQIKNPVTDIVNTNMINSLVNDFDQIEQETEKKNKYINMLDKVKSVMDEIRNTDKFKEMIDLIKEMEKGFKNDFEFPDLIDTNSDKKKADLTNNFNNINSNNFIDVSHSSDFDDNLDINEVPKTNLQGKKRNRDEVDETVKTNNKYVRKDLRITKKMQDKFPDENLKKKSIEELNKSKLYDEIILPDSEKLPKFNYPSSSVKKNILFIIELNEINEDNLSNLIVYLKIFFQKFLYTVDQSLKKVYFGGHLRFSEEIDQLITKLNIENLNIKYKVRTFNMHVYFHLSELISIFSEFKGEQKHSDFIESDYKQEFEKLTEMRKYYDKIFNE